jgi:hypothetical protein
LAPVGSLGELLKIGEAAQSGNAWVGIIKSAGDIDGFQEIALTASWYNLDGSEEVPDSLELWGASSDTNMEPNNPPAYQTRAHWYRSTGFKTGLRDLNAVSQGGPDVNGAVYRCCDKNVDTCYNFPEEEEEEPAR